MAGTADLAVGPRPASGTDGFLVDQARIVALISPAHKWARRAAIPVPLLDGEPLLLSAARDSFSRSAVERACHRRGFEPAIKFQSRSSPALAALAAHGVGVALLPDHAVPASFTGLVRPLHGADDLLRRESWLSWRTGTLTTPALHDFVRTSPPPGSNHSRHGHSAQTRPARTRPPALTAPGAGTQTGDSGHATACLVRRQRSAPIRQASVQVAST